MNLSKTDNRNTNQKDTQKDTKKFLIALAIYIVAIIFTDTMITNTINAPAHLQNNEKQGQTYHTGELRMLDRPTQPVEPSRGESLSSSRGRESREMVVQTTAYSHTGRKTYTNTWPKQGRTIATDINLIPPGSRVYIEGVDGWEGDWFTAEDKIPESSIRKGASIDIYMDKEADCWQWGRRNVKVVIIPPQEDLKNN